MHTPNTARDGMATEQGYYALVSYFRLLNGKTSLYNMSDIALKTGKINPNAASAYDIAKANEVEKLISAIGKVTLYSNLKIEAARKAYDKLTAIQKKQVENYETLVDAEKKYEKIVDEAVEKVEDLIYSIGEVTLESGEDITAARRAYNQLPPHVQKLVKNLKKLETELLKYGREIFDTHIYFLPSEEPTMEKPRFQIKWFEKDELEQFRNDKRFNTYSLSFSPTQPDMLAVAAFDGKEPIAMAGCSEDGAYLWQIGVDSVPGYEGRGLAVNLVTILKQEIIARGKVPYYGTSESHAVSRNVAIASGFLPAWCEIQVRKCMG